MVPIVPCSNEAMSRVVTDAAWMCFERTQTDSNENKETTFENTAQFIGTGEKKNQLMKCTLAHINISFVEQFWVRFMILTLELSLYARQIVVISLA